MTPRRLTRALVSLLLGAALAVPGVAGAVTDGDFEVKTTRSLLDLCTVSAEDARYKEALHFCHGYLVGAFHYYLATISGPNAKPLVCSPDPPPTRNAAMKGGMMGAVGGVAIGAIAGNAALGVTVGRVAGMGAGYIYSKSQEGSD